MQLNLIVSVATIVRSFLQKILFLLLNATKNVNRKIQESQRHQKNQIYEVKQMKIFNQQDHFGKFMVLKCYNSRDKENLEL